MLFHYYNLQRFLKKLLGIGVIIILVFFITNPYAIICYKRFLLSLKGIGSSQGWGYAVVSTGKIWPYLSGVFKQSYAFPVSVLAGAGILISIHKCETKYKYLAIGTALILFFIGLSLANPRISIFIGPFLCLFTGYGLSELSLKIEKISRHLMIFLIVALFLLPSFFTAQFAYDTIQDDKWHTSLQHWINRLYPNYQTTIGVFGDDALNPTNLPPFPFLNAQIVDLNCKESEIPLPEYVILGNYSDDISRWENHPIHHAYHLAFNLGYHQRYNNHLRWRTINQSRISGWIYKRNDDIALF